MMATTKISNATNSLYQSTLANQRRLATLFVDDVIQGEDQRRMRQPSWTGWQKASKSSATASVEGWSLLSGEAMDNGSLVDIKKDAASTLRTVASKAKGPDVRQTPSGNKVVKAKVGVWMAFKMLFTDYLHPVDQLKAKHMLADYDDPADDPVEELVEAGPTEAVGRKPKHSNVNWWAGYSLLAHAQFHSPTFTRANEMIVSAWIRKSMEADKVRRIEIAKVLPLAVRMAFVPTEQDVMAVKVDNAPAIRERYGRRCAKYWTSWFSVRRGHYESG
ncbi:polymerase-associated protein [Apple virus E]|nr:polymerase-associated protein [Apple virus E]